MSCGFFLCFISLDFTFCVNKMNERLARTANVEMNFRKIITVVLFRKNKPIRLSWI